MLNPQARTLARQQILTEYVAYKTGTPAKKPLAVESTSTPVRSRADLWSKIREGFTRNVAKLRKR